MNQVIMNDRCIILFIDPRDGEIFYVENGSIDLLEGYVYLLDEFDAFVDAGIEIIKENWAYSDLDLIRFMKFISKCCAKKHFL